jgi:hypothetical protein
LKKKIRIPTIKPWFFALAAVLLWAILLPLYSVGHFILLALVSAFAYLIGWLIFPGKVIEKEIIQEKVLTGDEKIDLLLRHGEEITGEMREIAGAVANPAVAGKIRSIADVTGKIYEDLLRDKNDYTQVRRFSEFFIPTVLKMFRSYRQSEADVSRGDNQTETMNRIASALDSIEASFNKQYDALFRNQHMDIDTDITVLEGMMKKEGLM